MQEQPCVLRTLTLCDGQVLEEDEGALASCYCLVDAIASSLSMPATAQHARRRRHEALCRAQERSDAGVPLRSFESRESRFLRLETP